MTPGVTPLFPDGSSSQQIWFKYLPDEELSTICEMSNDLRGLFLSLRLYAITHNGFTSDIDELWTKAKNFCGISRYKFRKLFPELVKFFTEIDGRLYFARDEDRMEESREKLRNSVIDGRKGAEARWKQRRMQAPQQINQPIATPSETPMASEPNREELPPVGEVEEEANHPPNSTSGLPDVTLSDSEYHEFVSRCAHLGFAAPNRVLGARLKKKFPSIPFREYPRFGNLTEGLANKQRQQSPGMWDHENITEESMLCEIARQKAVLANPTLLPRKPTEREMSDARLIEEARARDRANGRS
jgi:hypothetical protein